MEKYIYSYEYLLSDNYRGEQTFYMFSWTDEALYQISREGSCEEALKIVTELPVSELSRLASMAVYRRLYQVKDLLGDVYDKGLKELLAEFEKDGIETNLEGLLK